jgi:hypothetical protein
MYAKIIDNAVSKYPYSILNLRKDHPNVSFPEDALTRADVQTDYNVKTVVAVSKPTVSGYNAVEGTPTKVGSDWKQVWNSVLKSPSEVLDSEKVGTKLDESAIDHSGHVGERCTEVAPVWSGSQWDRTYTWAAATWLEKRQEEYGGPNAQFEYIVENGVDAFITRQEAIKTKYPKS